MNEDKSNPSVCERWLFIPPAWLSPKSRGGWPRPGREPSSQHLRLILLMGRGSSRGCSPLPPWLSVLSCQGSLLTVSAFLFLFFQRFNFLIVLSDVTPSHRAHALTYTHAHTRTHAHTHASAHTDSCRLHGTHACTHSQTHKHKHACMCVSHTHSLTHLLTQSTTHKQAHMHTHTDTHTHAQTHRLMFIHRYMQLLR